MLLSKSCIYGLRASILLAHKDSNEFITIQKISDELNVSFYFLTKVLQQLTMSDILESYKGPNGGVKLAKDARDIRFKDIVVSIDGDSLLNECVLGLPGCGFEAPCPMHAKWSALRTELDQLMTEVTLADLARQPDMRLSEITPEFADLNALNKFISKKYLKKNLNTYKT